MNAFRFPLHKGSYESDDHYAAREYAVGAAIVIASWCGTLAACVLSIVMFVTCGPIYVLVPPGVALSIAATIALMVAFVKGMDNI